MAVYVCYKCKFCFERAGEPEHCPDCGGMNVRLADDEETRDFKQGREDAALST